MELCDLTLNNYIYDTRPQNIVDRAANMGDPNETIFAEITFVSKDCPLEAAVLNVWTIMHHVAVGLEFMHERVQVHRDFKPANSEFRKLMLKLNLQVLYSAQANTWKLTDFGVSAEATSKRAHSTSGAHGTVSYMAPELVNSSKSEVFK